MYMWIWIKNKKQTQYNYVYIYWYKQISAPLKISESEKFLYIDIFVDTHT